MNSKHLENIENLISQLRTVRAGIDKCKKGKGFLTEEDLDAHSATVSIKIFKDGGGQQDFNFPDLWFEEIDTIFHIALKHYLAEEAGILKELETYVKPEKSQDDIVELTKG